MSQTNGQLPHWDLSVVYPGLETAEFTTGFQETLQAVDDLVQFFDEHGINRVETADLDEATVTLFEQVITQFNETFDQFFTLRAYVHGFIATNSRNETAQARFSEMQPYFAKFSLLRTRLVAWIGSLNVDALINRSDVASNHAYALRKAKMAATHQMSPAEEALASDLSLTGSRAWTRMFNNYLSQQTVTVEIDGEEKELALTAAQNLVYNPDRDVRRRAYEAVMAQLEKVRLPMATALNSIKGESLTLSRRRGWESPLAEVLFDNAMDRQTLDAMMDASRAALPDFRRYLKARARALGLPVLAWYDRWVALGQGSETWQYEEGTQFVVQQFATYSDKMANLARRAFSEDWVDAEPRDGKRGGAFCMWLRDGESRILANYEPSFTNVGTLAHELGHAYHNLNLAQRTLIQRDMPMTLAETASTFCQKIVENAALKTADPPDQRIILDGLLEYATRVVMHGTADFTFEQRLFTRRQQRDLSADELAEMMSNVQKEVFGESLDNYYPYRWVYVPHYYIANYYNFPYIFGLLFGLGLYAQYQEEPEPFQAGYDDLLASTGMGKAADLAARFGIDIRQSSFWEASLDVLRADIDRFESLATIREP